MADSDLSTSISALKTKIVNGIPTANVNELVSLARAVKALNLGEDKSLEDAINARANALVGSASADDVARLAGAIKQVLNPASITVTTLSTITGDLIPDQNIVHDLGSSTNRFKDLHLSGNTAVIGDSKISDDGTGIDIRDTSGNPRTIKAKEVTIDDGTGNPIKMKRGAGNTIQFLDSSDNSIETQEQASAPAMGAYNLLSQLPTSGVNTGTQAYVAENNKLYLFNGTGWYNIALISNPITAVTGNSATYELDNQGSPTTITLSSSDPDGANPIDGCIRNGDLQRHSKKESRERGIRRRSLHALDGRFTFCHGQCLASEALLELFARRDCRIWSGNQSDKDKD